MSGRFVLFCSVLGRIRPFHALSDHFGSFQTGLGCFEPLRKHLEPVTGHVETILAISDHLGPFQAVSGHFEPFWAVSQRFRSSRAISVNFEPVSSHFVAFLVKFGLSSAVLECFGPFWTSLERFRLFRGRLNGASWAISVWIGMFQDRFGLFLIVLDCFRLV
jgi:hypothetical protein